MSERSGFKFYLLMVKSWDLFWRKPVGELQKSSAYLSEFQFLHRVNGNNNYLPTYLIEILWILKKLPKWRSLIPCLTYGMCLVFVDFLQLAIYQLSLYGEMSTTWKLENQSDHFYLTEFLLGIPCWLITGAMGGTVLFLETCLLGSPCRERTNHLAGVISGKKTCWDIFRRIPILSLCRDTGSKELFPELLYKSSPFL